jgi:hypothetical protein
MKASNSRQDRMPVHAIVPPLPIKRINNNTPELVRRLSATSAKTSWGPLVIELFFGGD